MAGRAFIYTRISQDRERAGLGVLRQREDCEALAERRGLTVVEVFTDDDVSAYSGAERPQYKAMLERLGEVEAVIVYHPDRLHRSPIELEAWIDATGGKGTAKVRTLTVQAGDLDLNTANGRMVARITGDVARHESEQKSERVQRKMAELARAGKWTGGTRPFGWNVTDSLLVVNETEAEVVRETTAAVIRGESLGSLVRSLNERGILTTAGKPWGYAQLRQMLLRPRNAGIATLKGAEVGRTEAPALVSEAQYRAVVGILSDPKRRRSQTNKARYLLGGIARCECGELVRSSTVTNRRGEKLPTYRCPVRGKGHVGKRIEYVDRLVAEHAGTDRLFALERAAKRGRDATLEAERLELEAERIVLANRGEDIARKIAAGDILPDLIATVNADLKARREDLQRRMAEVELRSARPPVSPSSFSELLKSPDFWRNSRGSWRARVKRAASQWSALTIDERRDWLRANYEITLLRSNGARAREFDPSTVRIEWKEAPTGLARTEKTRELEQK